MLSKKQRESDDEENRLKKKKRKKKLDPYNRSQVRNLDRNPKDDDFDGTYDYRQ